ncbi:hypothetical protein [Bacillus stratosphericus]|uniref:hypothetical protein n=1 Tax=Bacillus stratosphericus TaxID=293386 RepID=UPI001CFADEFA|nr:hypothetical protein [Bacillus stratosphericus]
MKRQLKKVLVGQEAVYKKQAIKPEAIEQLRVVRNEFSERAGRSAFVVISDQTLKQWSLKRKKKFSILRVSENKKERNPWMFS